MACDNKFQKYLDLADLDFIPETLIVGTFNPDLPGKNPTGWFFGRKESNYLWDVLPRLYGENTLINAGSAEWKQFCRDKKIAITDLISSIEDAEPENPKHVHMLAGLSDDALVYNFDDFAFVNIVQLLQRHHSIKNVYLTRGITEAFWRHVWNPVMRYCQVNGIYEQRLLPPSAEVSYQHEAYNRDNPEQTISRIEDYILFRWRQEWHAIG